MGKAGRPPVLNDKKRLEIVAILSVGCSRTVAAQYVGCARSTILRTVERDPSFAAQMGKAKSNAELSLVKNIRKAANKEQYWRAAAWALERGFPDKYALRGPHVITPDQVCDLLAKFTEIIINEVPARYRSGILKKMTLLSRELNIELNGEEEDDSH